MMTLPLPPILSAMYWQAISPAWTLLVCTVASAPGGGDVDRDDDDAGRLRRLTAGAIAFGSAALSRIMSTPEAMKLSIWVNCLFRS